MQIKIDSIKVKKRVRTDLGNLEPLKESIKRYGLLHPITVNEKNELIAGNRRLEAARQLGWNLIPAQVVSVCDKADLLELELEENMQRENFTDEELRTGYMKLEKLRNPGFLRRIVTAIGAFFARLFERFFA